MIFGNSGRFVEPNGMNIFRARIARCNAAASQKREKRKARRKGWRIEAKKGTSGTRGRERERRRVFFSKSEHQTSLLEEKEIVRKEKKIMKKRRSCRAFDEGALTRLQRPAGYQRLKMSLQDDLVRFRRFQIAQDARVGNFDRPILQRSHVPLSNEIFLSL